MFATRQPRAREIVGREILDQDHWPRIPRISNDSKDSKNWKIGIRSVNSKKLARSYPRFLTRVNNSIRNGEKEEDRQEEMEVQSG